MSLKSRLEKMERKQEHKTAGVIFGYYCAARGKALQVFDAQSYAKLASVPIINRCWHFSFTPPASASRGSSCPGAWWPIHDQPE